MIDFLMNLILIINLILAIFLFATSISKSRQFNTVFCGFFSTSLLMIMMGMFVYVKSANAHFFLVGYRIYCVGLLFFPVFWYLFACDMFESKERNWKQIMVHFIYPSIVSIFFLAAPSEIFIGKDGMGNLLTLDINGKFNIFYIGYFIPRFNSIVFYSIYVIATLRVLILQIMHKKGNVQKMAKIFFIGLVIPTIVYTLAYTGFFIDYKTLIESINYLIVLTLFVYLVLAMKMLNTTPLNEDIIIDSLDQAYMYINNKRDIIDCNQSAREFFKEDFEDVILPINIDKIKRFPNDLFDKDIDEYDMEIESGNDTKFYKFTKYNVKNDKDRKDFVGILIYDITEFTKLKLELEERSYKDALTGIYNRGTFFNLSKQYIKENKRNNYLILFDLDYFKKVNDTYGHVCGDYVLKRTCEIVKENIREEDIFCRYGGEEFVILLKDIKVIDLFSLVEKIRKKINDYDFVYGDTSFNISISGGVSKVDTKQGIEKAITIADENMYIAKNNGRNQIEW